MYMLVLLRDSHRSIQGTLKSRLRDVIFQEIWCVNGMSVDFFRAWFMCFWVKLELIMSMRSTCKSWDRLNHSYLHWKMEKPLVWRMRIKETTGIKERQEYRWSTERNSRLLVMCIILIKQLINRVKYPILECANLRLLESDSMNV